MNSELILREECKKKLDKLRSRRISIKHYSLWSSYDNNLLSSPQAVTSHSQAFLSPLARPKLNSLFTVKHNSCQQEARFRYKISLFLFIENVIIHGPGYMTYVYDVLCIIVISNVR